jgi:ankyrin repeat protein
MPSNSRYPDPPLSFPLGHPITSTGRRLFAAASSSTLGPLPTHSDDTSYTSLIDVITINEIDAFGRTALYFACQNGHLRLAQNLITSLANIDAANFAKETPLFAASKNNHPSLVKLLLESGADSLKRTKKGAEPIHVACECGHLEVVEIIVSQDIGSIHAIFGNRPFRHTSKRIYKGYYNEYDSIAIAARHGHLHVVKYLYKAKLSHRLALSVFRHNSSHSESHVVNALYEAICARHFDVAKFLVDEGHWDVNSPTCIGYNSLLKACYYGDEVAVRFLVDVLHADIRVTTDIDCRAGSYCNRNTYTCLHLACSFFDPTRASRIAKFLVENGADPHTVIGCEFSPLDIARENELVDFVDFVDLRSRRSALRCQVLLCVRRTRMRMRDDAVAVASVDDGEAVATTETTVTATTTDPILRLFRAVTSAIERRIFSVRINANPNVSVVLVPGHGSLLKFLASVPSGYSRQSGEGQVLRKIVEYLGGEIK